MLLIRFFVLVTLVGTGLFIETVAAQQEKAESQTKPEPVPFHSMSLPGLDNVFQIDKQFYSGSGPHGELSFQALKKLGIKTIVSVDGTPPDLEHARKAGMKYIHIPIGYDGVSEDAGLAFARVARDLKGPVYIHCHHGKHRGPTAAAVIGICRGTLNQKSVQQFLTQAGTSKDYAGLWRDVKKFKVPDSNAILPELVESAKVPPMVSAMAQISHDFELSDQLLQNKPENRKQRLRVLVLLREGLHETARKYSGDYDEMFKQWLTESEQQVKSLELAVQQGDQQAFTTGMKTLKFQCKRCHKAYRD
ncbi:cytochrome c [Gimesia algae]|uniref:Cytochrome C n=1 Tax=Gimesia algae TaxID=2527971 RepID=A0A517V936_9PLAN|nr:cytochrome c [Gimesia algae]QDT89531.1 Cytochrome C' [Gimesia algae]